MLTSQFLLILMAFMLGIRHGFDLDHLATIDSITRAIADRGYPISLNFSSKIVGFLFSLGHGLVVIAVSLIISCKIMKPQIPEWLDSVGNYISITFLFIFGFLNLWNVSVKNYLAKKLIYKNFNPLFIILIGALFAFSFDTLSQVALFSLSASALAGWLFSATLGIVFTLGMMMADGLNGLLVAILIKRVDKISFFISRLFGLLIASFSLIVGTIKLYSAI
jgi:nickel/cobalt transporter (NiCoT) family protein